MSYFLWFLCFDDSLILNSTVEFDEDDFLYGDSNMELESVEEQKLEQEPSL